MTLPQGLREVDDPAEIISSADNVGAGTPA